MTDIAEIKESSEVEVIKNRNIIESCYQLTIGEHRLITSCIQVINDRTCENKPIRIRVEEFAKAWGISRPSAHGQLKEACDRMWDRVIHISLAGSRKGVESVRWLQRKIDFECGEVELHFTDKIYREMYKIADDARVPILLSTMAKFTYSHSHRIYDNMCSRQPLAANSWRWELSLVELRDVLDIKSRYPVWADLRKWVIVPAAEEISKHSEFSLVWNVIAKEGRSISKIEFVAAIKQGRELTTRSNLPRMKTEISPDFYPQESTISILITQGMTEDFILSQVPRFILYFQERGDMHNTWQTKFVAHCELHWRSENAGSKQSELFPRPSSTRVKASKTFDHRSGKWEGNGGQGGRNVKPSQSLDEFINRATDRSWATDKEVTR